MRWEMVSMFWRRMAIVAHYFRMAISRHVGGGIIPEWISNFTFGPDGAGGCFDAPRKAGGNVYTLQVKVSPAAHGSLSTGYV